MSLSAKAALLRAKQPTVQENGDRLATIKRSGGDELRINWSQFEGRNFVNAQVWSNGYPQKDKRITIRLSELPAFAEGIEIALDRALNETAPAAATPKPKPQKVVTPMPPDDALDDILPMSLN